MVTIETPPRVNTDADAKEQLMTMRQYLLRITESLQRQLSALEDRIAVLENK